MPDHSTSTATYCVVFAVLIVLTGITVGVALVDLGPVNNVAAVGIAVIKASLVLVYFMHLRFTSRLTWVFAGAGFFWLIVLITFTMSDELTRNWLGVPGK
jgi:cytochrome c oxidase subunit 4